MTQRHLTKTIGIFICFIILAVCVSCSHSSSYSYKKTLSHKNTQTANVLKESPDTIWKPKKRNDFPDSNHSQVKKWVKLFNGKLRPSFKKWMGRLGEYGPTISKVLEEEGAPQDLIYLAMIESGFNPTAKSHANAVGTWQFISSTGKMYGLNNGFFEDDRRNMVQATRAAARHLKDLHKIYGDWYLAFAAYNAGPGKVNSAIKHAHSKNFWKISSSRRRYLRQETKDYVPKILAARHIVKNYNKYGYSKNSFGRPIQYERVLVPDASDFKTIAKSAKTSTKTIAELNPSLILGITPPGKSFVYVPKGAADEFNKRYAMIPSSQRVSSLQYKAGSRESIYSIAQKYNLSAAKLAQINKIKSSRVKKHLKRGTIIKIPGDKNTLNTIAKLSAKALASSSNKSRTRTKYYKVRAGDTLSKIARKNGTSIKKLAQWNKLKSSSTLRIGQRLKINSGTGYTTTSTGGFLAKYTPSSKRSRISGVSHIIIQDAQSGSEFVSNKPETIEISSALAAEYAEPKEDAAQPAIVKDLDGEILTFGQKKEEPKKKEVIKYHTIKPGESLSLIASKYKLRISELKDLNNLKSNTIKINQKLIVSKSYAKVAQKETKPKQNQKQIYTVQSGDSLYGIALKHRVSVDAIKNANGLNSNTIKPGQKIKIVKGSYVAKKSSSKSNQKVIYHKVKAGETLWSLSRKYDVKIQDIKDWNKMESDTVRPNQKIKIIAMLTSPKTKV